MGIDGAYGPEARMTLQDLRYVVALADHGHFGRAAAACDIGQSTLSTQIKKLEKQLGVTLFERTTKSVSVTAIGAEIVGRARNILAEVDAIMSVGQQTSGPLAGDFSFGGMAVDPHIEAVGSGTVKLKSYKGKLNSEGMANVQIGDQ